MISRKVKFLSAAVMVAALIATVAIARTVHTRTPAIGAQPSHSSTMGAAPRDAARSPLHGTIACGTMSYSECEQLEQMLPM